MTEWPKLTAATELRSHLMLGAHVCLGPCQDSPQFRPVIEQAARLQRIEQVLGDKGYDAEHNHRLCREQLGIASTLIPPRRGWGGSRRWPTTPYRREMKSDFDKRAYGQRWQAESNFSRHKRVLGAFLRARTWLTQQWEALLRVLTHNICLLAAT